MILLEMIFADERDLAEGWEKEAERRLALWPDDPVAKVFAFCAAELQDRARRQATRTAKLYVNEFADLHRVSEPTVRRWIKQGRLDADRTQMGWVIDRGATVKPAEKRPRRRVRQVA